LHFATELRAHDFRQSSAAAKNWPLQQFSFSGSIAVATPFDIPRLCRDTGPPSLAGFVFLGFVVLRIGAFESEAQAIRRAARRRLPPLIRVKW